MQRVKNLSLFALCIGLNIQINAQPNNFSVSKVLSVDDPEHVYQIVLNDQFIFCLGYSYKEDGTGTYTRLNKYNDDLDLIWSLKIDSTHQNTFINIGILNNQIYLHGTHGEVIKNPYQRTLYQYFYTIDLNGVIKDKTQIGQSNFFGTNANIIKNDNFLWLAYSEANSTNLSSDSLTSIITSINLETKELKKYRSKYNESWSVNIENVGSNIVSFSRFGGKRSLLKRGRIIASTIVNDELIETLLDYGKCEFYLNSTTLEKHKILIYTFLDQFLEKGPRYLRRTEIDSKLNILNTKEISFSSMNIDDLRQDFYYEGSNLWVVAVRNGKRLILKINKMGEVVAEYNLKEIPYTSVFAVDKNNIWIWGNRKIKKVTIHP